MYKMRLSTEDRIKKLALTGAVKVIMGDEELSATCCKLPDGVRMTKTIDIMEDLILYGWNYNEGNIPVYVDFLPESLEWRISTPELITLTFQELIFLGFNGHNTPIFQIDGVECSGYTAISNKMFGYYRKEIKVIVRPYLIREFNPDDLKFVEWRKVKGNSYPVYKYGESNKLIKGTKGLKKEFPQLTSEYIKTLEPNDMKKPLQRHEELIKKFDINKVGDKYEILGEIYLDSQRKVIAYIKEAGESISRETAKKMFESL